MGQKPVLIKMSTSQLACTYAALILHDEGMAINVDNLKALTSASGATVESYWPMLFEKALGGKDINDLITTVSSSGGRGGGGGVGGAVEEAAEEAKEEEKKESSSSDEGGMCGGGMFDDDY